MPKVLIREKDNSTSGLLESNNFTVVVPGFAGHSAPGYNLDDVLDENGCAEFTSQADFVNYVGLRGACDGIAPESVSLANFVATEVPGNNGTKTNKYIYRYQDDLIVDNLLEYDEIDVDEDKKETVTTTNGETVTKTIRVKVRKEDKSKGRLKLKKDKLSGIYYYNEENDTEKKRFVYITNGTTNTPGRNILQLEAGGTARDAVVYKYYRLVPVTDLKQILTVVEDKKSKGVYYKIREDANFVIANSLDNFGDDGVAFRHKGNQIAYEVLGMGFPVLFKQLHGTWVSPLKEDKKTPMYTHELQDPNFWECLKDKSMYNFRFITTGGDFSADVNNLIVKIANYTNNTTIEDHEIFGIDHGRGDCIALCDFNEEDSDNPINTTSMKNLLTSVGTVVNKIDGSKFGAIFGPRVVFQMSDTEANLFEGGDSARTFPASIYYLSCLANSLTKYSEWYAAAGYTRGISKRRVDYTTIKFGEIANNTLAPRVINEYTDRAVNLVICEHNNYYLGGNRTSYQLNRSGLTFSHYLNVRQLCTTIKKRLYSVCKQFTFDPNSELLWINFVNAIKPTLEAMRADQGINGYKISQVKTNKKGVLVAKIRIVPVEAVEDFDISLYLEDSLSGIVLGADETEAE